MRRPECEKFWTSLYYGSRGSCKSLHQIKEVIHVMRYLTWLYAKYPDLQPAIVFTNQKMAPWLEHEYKKFIYYWDDADDLHFCPRKDCWKGTQKHRLHNAYVVFDDISTILPPDNWQNTPVWMRKMFMQARHNGIRILANLQDPFAVDVNFRRCVDVAYKFTKLFGNADPDETRPAVKRIFGMYRRRKVEAATLWRYGDLPEQSIRMLIDSREEQNEQLKKMGKEMHVVYDDSWRGSIHLYNRTGHFLGMRISATNAYDTLQDVKEYEPKGFLHTELACIDPKHNHTDPKAPNYCGYKKAYHEIV